MSYNCNKNEIIRQNKQPQWLAKTKKNIFKKVAIATFFYQSCDIIRVEKIKGVIK